MFSLIHGCNFLLTGQTCAPAYPWLRGRGHETANGVAGTGNTKVGGSDRLRSLRTWLHHHRCQTTARSYCKAKGEGGGGEETRSGCTDRRRERRGGDGVSKEGEIRLLSWDKGREIASGIFFSFTTQNPSRKKTKHLQQRTHGARKRGKFFSSSALKDSSCTVAVFLNPRCLSTTELFCKTDSWAESEPHEAKTFFFFFRVRRRQNVRSGLFLISGQITLHIIRELWVQTRWDLEHAVIFKLFNKVHKVAAPY